LLKLDLYGVERLFPRKLLEDFLAQLLCFPEKFLIFDEHAVQLQRSVCAEMLAQQHVAHVDGVGKCGFLGQFFEGCAGIVVVHELIVALPELNHFCAPKVVQMKDTVNLAAAIHHRK
jgi:hypothetical protein